MEEFWHASIDNKAASNEVGGLHKGPLRLCFGADFAFDSTDSNETRTEHVFFRAKSY